MPSATKHNPPSDVHYMEFHRIILIEYSLIGILNLPEEMKHDNAF